MGVADPPGQGEIYGVEPHSVDLHSPTYDSPGGSTGQRFQSYRITSATFYTVIAVIFFLIPSVSLYDGQFQHG